MAGNAFIRETIQRLRRVRNSIVRDMPFFGCLTGLLRFSLDTDVHTVYCDGERIAFNPAFLAAVSDRSLKFIMLHEILHMALDHKRRRENRECDVFDLAADIVVNSAILHECGMDESSITISMAAPTPEYEYCTGVQVHTLPDGEEGYEYTAEEVYEKLMKKKDEDGNDTDDDSNGDDSNSDESDDDESDDDESDDEGSDDEGSDDEGSDDEGSDDEGSDDEGSDDEGSDDEGSDDEGSDDEGSDDEGSDDESGSKESDGKSAWCPGNSRKACKSGVGAGGNGKCSSGASKEYGRRFDDHSQWDKNETDRNGCALNQIWKTGVMNASSFVEGIPGFGGPPACAERAIEDYRREGQLDWRTILQDFLQEEVNDYSFSPPDRRLSDSPFFLPDFNQTEAVVRNIIFAVDASGSMSSEIISRIRSEIESAIESFPVFRGWICYFDAGVSEPVPFESSDEMMKTKVMGGGGTEPDEVFRMINEEFKPRITAMGEEISAIIILSDGLFNTPPESVAEGIPVIWILTTGYNSIGWGKVVYYETGDQTWEMFRQ